MVVILQYLRYSFTRITRGVCRHGIISDCRSVHGQCLGCGWLLLGASKCSTARPAGCRLPTSWTWKVDGVCLPVRTGNKKSRYQEVEISRDQETRKSTKQQHSLAKALRSYCTRWPYQRQTMRLKDSDEDSESSSPQACAPSSIIVIAATNDQLPTFTRNGMQ